MLVSLRQLLKKMAHVGCIRAWLKCIPSDFLISSLLLILGAGLIRWPLWNDKASAAVLIGALWGAAAVLTGNGINRYYQHDESEEELESKRRKIRAALMPEIIRIAINHMEHTRYFRQQAESMSKGVARPHAEDFLSYMPRETETFNQLIAQILCLPEKEIDALTTFYGNLEITRDILRKHAKPGAQGVVLNSLNAREIAEAMKSDCATAAEVVALIAPQRKIQYEVQSPIFLTEALLKASQTTADSRV